MISIEQIRAARALLDWTQDRLCEASGVSKPTINMIERRLANPKQDTLAAIRHAFEKAGVDFTEGSGVRLRSMVLKTQIFEGEDSLIRLMNDIFDTLHGTDDMLTISGVSEEKYSGLGGKKVVKLIHLRLKHGIRSRLLCCEGDTNFIEPIDHYRWVPQAFFNPVPTYVYGNKYAMLLWGPPQKVVLIENAEIAASFRKQHDALWGVSKVPVLKSKKKK